MKTTSTTRFQFAATILGALAVLALALAPATVHAQPVGSTGAGGGCHYTDKDGYDIPIDDGQGVIVDGKTVTCNGGTITVGAAPKTNVDGAQQQHLDPNASAQTASPSKPPLVNRNVPTSRVH
jgi:hypothetical protein